MILASKSIIKEIASRTLNNKENFDIIIPQFFFIRRAEIKPHMI